MKAKTEPGGSPRIRFSAALLKPAANGRSVSWTFLKLPPEASRKLPSRGQVAVEGTFRGHAMKTTLEPDGEGGHWMKVDRKLREAAGASAGDVVELEIAPLAMALEPSVPPDLCKALAAAPAAARATWADITPGARRDFVQWIETAKQEQTRARRIAVACDKLAKGQRRPCCFDRSGMYGKSMSCPVAEEAPIPAADRR